MSGRFSSDMTTRFDDVRHHHAARTTIALPEQAISHECCWRNTPKATSAASTTCARASRARLAIGRGAGAAHAMGDALLRRAARGFIPAGRIDSAAGTALGATLINCFVQPVGDSIAAAEEGYPGIYTALTERPRRCAAAAAWATTSRASGPRRAGVGTTQSSASGPVSYMRVFDRSCETVESAGSRRGAQMGVLRCDHPTWRTSSTPRTQGDLSNFNISVGVTDAFMRAVDEDSEIELVHPGRAGCARRRPAGAARATTACGSTAAARARAVGPDHAVHLRPCRAGRAVHRPHQRRQQPRLLRAHRLDQPVR
jgi:ribonucleoside-diphosphate reductase alpha chain